MLVRAHKRAVTEGEELPLVITWHRHAPVLAVTEIDRLVFQFRRGIGRDACCRDPATAPEPVDCGSAARPNAGPPRSP